MDANFSAVIGLPTNVGSIPSAPREQILFKGSPDEQLIAFRVAIKKDIRIGLENGVPYVKTRKDFEKVVECIVSDKLDGWENYQKDLDY